MRAKSSLLLKWCSRRTVQTRRPRMANLSDSLQHVKEHLDQLCPDENVCQICKRLGHKWRNRVLNPATTVHLFLLQLLANVSMEGVRNGAGLSVTDPALCK